MALEHPLLRGAGTPHGFGLRDDPPPAGVVGPRQVHGARVADARDCQRRPETEADAVVASRPFAWPVAVVTADCVPVLAASGAAVAAIHAGWRGLAAGVVEAGVAALRARGGGGRVVAAVGPRIGPCCYEVDEPVAGPLRERFGAALDAALVPTRPGHWRLDLARLVCEALARVGLEPHAVGVLSGVCTACDARRFHSYRRDGARAGRLVHWIAPAPGSSGPARDSG